MPGGHRLNKSLQRNHDITFISGLFSANHSRLLLLCSSL